MQVYLGLLDCYQPADKGAARLWSRFSHTKSLFFGLHQRLGTCKVAMLCYFREIC